MLQKTVGVLVLAVVLCGGVAKYALVKTEARVKQSMGLFQHLYH